jgi:hypothetical protein
MPFEKIQSKSHKVNRVNVAVGNTKGGSYITIPRDIIRAVGFDVGDRIVLMRGMGEDAGIVAIRKARSDEQSGSFKVSGGSNDKAGRISVTARNYGGIDSHFPYTDCKSYAQGTTLYITLPRHLRADLEDHERTQARLSHATPLEVVS